MYTIYLRSLCFLVLLLSLLPQNGLSQNSTVTVDFKTKQIDFSSKTLNKRDAVQLRVINYNPNLYKLSVVDVDTLDIIPPNNGTLLSDFLNNNNLADLVANLSSVVSIVPALAGGKALVMASGGDKSATPAVAEIQSGEIDTILQQKRQIDNINQDAEKLLYNLQRKFRIRTEPFISCTEGEIASEKTITGIEQEMAVLRERLINEQHTIEEQAFSYIKKVSPHYTAIQNDAGLKLNDTLIRGSYARMNTALVAAQSNISLPAQDKLITQLKQLQLSSAGCYTSLPLYLFDDRKKITIEFKPRADSLGLPPYKTTFFLPWVPRQIWGVSAGIYTGGLFNETYAMKQNEDSSFSIMKEKRSGKAEFGINALAYTGWNLTKEKCNYLGIAFGAGMSVADKPKPRILLGASFITGDKNRLMITGGVIGGFVSRLSSAYSTGSKYTANPGTVTRDVIRPGWFLSLNYSFIN